MVNAVSAVYWGSQIARDPSEGFRALGRDLGMAVTNNAGGIANFLNTDSFSLNMGFVTLGFSNANGYKTFSLGADFYIPWTTIYGGPDMQVVQSTDGQSDVEHGAHIGVGVSS